MSDPIFDGYRELLNDYTEATRQVNEYKALLPIERDMLAKREAELQADVTGTNAEARKASLLLLCEADKDYLETRDALRLIEADLAKVEGLREQAANLMRIARLQIELQTSDNFRVAAELGNRELSRTH